MEDGWIFNVKLFDIKLIFPLKQQIFIQLIIERTSAETIFKVVDKHHLDRPQIKSIKLVCLDFKIGVVFLINALKLIGTNFFHQGVVDIVDVFQESCYVFGTDEFIVICFKKGYRVIEICHFVLVGVVKDVVILDQVLGNYEIVVHDEPHLLPSLIFKASLYCVVTLGKINFSFSEQLTGRSGRVEERIA